MTRPTPRRPASSRGGTQRPRKIAGQAPSSSASPKEVDDTTTVEPDHDDAAVADTRRGDEARGDKARDDAARDDAARDDAARDDADGGAPDGDGQDGFLARATTTRLLTIALAIASVVMVGLGGVLLVQEVTGEDAAGDGGVLKDRPVIAAELDVIDGVEAAAKAAQEIVAVDYQKFDAEVDTAAKLMTSDFEKDYRQTTEDVKKDIVDQLTVVQANVVAQGVVNASRTRLQALVFLNQVVTRTRDDKPETVVTPYKVLVTMVHTDKGWLVDGLDTDAEPQDKSN